jgi:hypothetical protein
MIARAREQRVLKVIADERLTPIFTADLATGILGALNVASPGVCT